MQVVILCHSSNGMRTADTEVHVYEELHGDVMPAEMCLDDLEACCLAITDLSVEMQ
jgi:hypothetical protein